MLKPNYGVGALYLGFLDKCSDPMNSCRLQFHDTKTNMEPQPRCSKSLMYPLDTPSPQIRYPWQVNMPQLESGNVKLTYMYQY
jgi:hypothetical protein